MKNLLNILFFASFLFIAQDSEAKVQHNRSKKPIGAPIDGGLLTVLGAGGVIYYASRKNKFK